MRPQYTTVNIRKPAPVLSLHIILRPHSSFINRQMMSFIEKDLAQNHALHLVVLPLLLQPEMVPQSSLNTRDLDIFEKSPVILQKVLQLEFAPCFLMIRFRLWKRHHQGMPCSHCILSGSFCSQLILSLMLVTLVTWLRCCLSSFSTTKLLFFSTLQFIRIRGRGTLKQCKYPFVTHSIDWLIDWLIIFIWNHVSCISQKIIIWYHYYLSQCSNYPQFGQWELPQGGFCLLLTRFPILLEHLHALWHSKTFQAHPPPPPSPTWKLPFPSKSSGSFQRNVALKTKIQLPDVFIATGVSIVPGLLSVENKKKYICIYIDKRSFTPIFLCLSLY